MLRIIIALLVFFISTVYVHAQNIQPAADAKMNSYIAALMKKMTVQEKIGQLNLPTIGVTVTGPILSKDVEDKIKNGFVGGVLNTHGQSAVRKLQDLAIQNSRLKIPLFFGFDVIHGHTTLFPIPLAMACSWDLNLIEKSARIAAEESTADGLNWTFSPMVDLARDPRWGRVAEGAGEDPLLGSLIAKAMVKGYQQDDLRNRTSLMACVKHFALYGAAEGGRDYNTVDMSPLKMYEYYLPPYKAAVDAGVASVMSSFNEINGIPATANKWLLTSLLRDQWKYKGFVVTDYTAIHEMIDHGIGNSQAVSEKALKAGADMDMVGEDYLNTLQQSLKENKLSINDIDAACRRILEAKYKLGLFDDPYKNLHEISTPVIFTKANRMAAQYTAERSMVLLKNTNNLLPLKKSGSIALVGPLAKNIRDLSGPHAAVADWHNAVSVMTGLQKIPGIKIKYAKGSNITDDTLLIKQLNGDPNDLEIDSRNAQQLIDEAVNIANESDVVVAVLGESQGMSGEAASRSDIGLPASQVLLLKALMKTGKPLVLVLMNGRPLTLDWESNNVPAILETWFAGTEAGNSIANVLFGEYNPSAKLTMSFPHNAGQIPVYYNHKNTGRPYDNVSGDKYKSRYLDVSNEPLFPFGYGLSYTTFSYSNFRSDKSTITSKEKFNVSVNITNTGNYGGEEIIQLYLQRQSASVTQPVKKLIGFKKIFLARGESKTIVFPLGPTELQFYNNDLKLVNEPGKCSLLIGGNSRDVIGLDFQIKN